MVNVISLCYSVGPCFSTFKVHINHLGGLIKTQVRISADPGGAKDSAALTSLQMVPILLVHRPHFEDLEFKKQGAATIKCSLKRISPTGVTEHCQIAWCLYSGYSGARGEDETLHFQQVLR